MKENFTPGEWKIEEPVKDDEPRFNDGYNYRIWGGDKKHRHSLALVLCNGRPGDTDYPQHCFAESKANTHLIAAAPEMYNKLKEVKEFITEFNQSLTAIHPHFRKKMDKLENNITELLKKARGEQ